MSALLTTLLTAGPSLIRLFGESKGGKTEQVAHTLADVVSTLSGQPTLDKKAKLQSLVDSLPPEEISRIQIGLAQITADREKAALEHDQAMHSEQQQTIRSSADIKGIRPQIANRHSWITIVYLIGFEAASAAGYGTGASLEIAMVIAAPTLAWFGFRTWDKFSKQGASN